MGSQIPHPNVAILWLHETKAGLDEEGGEPIPNFVLVRASGDVNMPSVWFAPNGGTYLVSEQELLQAASTIEHLKLKLAETRRQVLQWKSNYMQLREYVEHLKNAFNSLMNTKMSITNLSINYVLELLYAYRSLEKALKALTGPRFTLNKYVVMLAAMALIAGILYIRPELVDKILWWISANALLVIIIAALIALVVYYGSRRGRK